MGLRVIGAGLPRTGTTSLKAALERLLGGRCYHMREVDDAQIPEWHRLALGGEPAWDALFDGWVAAVDYPASAFWRELVAHYPDAVVVMTHRDPASWWRSAQDTVLHSMQQADDDKLAFRQMASALFARDLGPRFLDEGVAVDAMARRADEVRTAVPRDRLVEWTAGDGWQPLCAALGVPVPEAPYPHVNTTAQFRARLS